ncbi:TPA: voltage-gated chloride channel ClcB [Candidatus Sumerlaeota bacterium]|jgi:chloride channel protein, CIC family|nr:voltage-gated chloride channel ClcB [Candidatus Sumerlaeota bacterium]
MPHSTPRPKHQKLSLFFLQGTKGRLWLAEHLHPSELQRTLFWAGLIGVLGGASTALFRWVVYQVHVLLTRQTTGSMVESFVNLPTWQRLLVPALGGVLAGLVILLGKRFGRSKNTTDYMEAVALGNGVLSMRSSLVKTVSSLFSIASGGSIGREGPMVQLSALCASQLGRLRKWSTPRRRLMVACGAAAGIASAYNAPIAGALFVAEIVLGSIAMESFGPLVFASVLATQTQHFLHGSDPLYKIPQFQMGTGWDLIVYMLLGVLCGVLAPWFLRALRLSEKAFSYIKAPIYVRVGLGGLIVGLLAIWYPQVCGNGYSVVTGILNAQWAWQAILIIFILKIVATCATFGSGAVGGVFTPTIFVGAAVGYLFGVACPHFWPGTPPIPGALALAGMGMFLAATTHAPLMAILMIFEMTLDYQIIMPLMLGCVVAYYAAHGLETHSIYSVTLARKGALTFAKHMARLTVGGLMRKDPVCVLDTARFSEITRMFIAQTFKYLYVVDQAGMYLGVIALHDVKEYLNTPELSDLVIARELVHDTVPTTCATARLSETLDLFAQHDGERLPVLSEEVPAKLVGSIAKSDVFLALVEQKKIGKA